MSAVVKYMQSYDNYFWQYEDGGKVIAVPEGNTLGYSEHIINEIIFYLAPHGLPRFGSLLLALGATNSQGSKILKDIVHYIDRQQTYSDEVADGVLFAELLTQLPVKYKKGNLRLELLRGIFLKSHNAVGAKMSTQILKELESKPSISSYPAILRRMELTGLDRANKITNDFKALSIIGRELNSVDAILERLSGLPSIERELKELDLELENSVAEDDLIKSLTSKDETFHVGVLVTRLVSGLHIPFHSSLPSDQALGGVADITNKGNFDKLLMSEFAFDDQILMSRLANNEALYHHREVPPADNNYSRVILIDVTLKNWGAIRSISFATMLAITNHPKNKNPNRVFLIGKSYKEIAFESVDDIINGLQILDSSLDPGEGLYELFTTEEIKVSEIFYIGSAESLSCSVMQRFTADLGKRIDHWIHPDDKGKISVYKNPKRGKRFIQELTLPLKNIWENRRREERERINHIEGDYPILFPFSKLKTKWNGDIYTYCVTKDKAILRLFREPYLFNTGCTLISGNFLRSDSLKAVITHDDLSITALVRDKNKDYVLVNYPSEKRTSIQYFRHSKAYKEFDIQGSFFIGRSRFKTVFIDLEGNVSSKESNFDNKSKKKDEYLYSQVYLNLNKVYISNKHRLVFGKQDLVLKNNQITLLHQGYNNGVAIEAKSESSGVYRFPDGSIIEHNRNGMLVLTSSNSDIPNIYIPCVLVLPIGATTESTFAGNEFYRMKYKVELLLKNHNGRSIEITKTIRSHLKDIRLKQAKAMADNGLIVSSDETKMNSLIKDLGEMKIPFIIRKTGLKQEVISPVDFYNRYIQQFIHQIISHGT